MDIFTGEAGWLEVICGPMFSGKSEELIRRLRRARIARKCVQAFKPALDDRYSSTEIVSHGDHRLPSEIVSSADEILEKVEGLTQVIGIDEANFFGQDLVNIVTELADSGRQVIVAGLDTDYLGRPFPPMPDLLCVAESITKTLAICMRCGHPAKHTQRLVESNDLIVVGASGLYEARCRVCFEPVFSRQEVLEFARQGEPSGQPLAYRLDLADPKKDVL
jgi:thymidine kinase